MRSMSYHPVYPWHFFKLQMFFAVLASMLTGRSRRAKPTEGQQTTRWRRATFVLRDRQDRSRT